MMMTTSEDFLASLRSCKHTYLLLFCVLCAGTDTGGILQTQASATVLCLCTGTDTGGIQNRLGVLFFMLLYLSLMSLSSLPVWREERLLYFRERDSGAYGSAAYYIAVWFDVAMHNSFCLCARMCMRVRA